MKVSFLGYDNEAKLAAEKEEISEKISKEIRDLPGSDRFFIVEFSISGDSLDAASELSGIRDNKLFPILGCWTTIHQRDSKEIFLSKLRCLSVS